MGTLDKAKTIFDETDTNSAVSQLCNLDYTNCDLGIATHGFSQGAQLASLGKTWWFCGSNYDMNADRIIFITHIRISIKVAIFLLKSLQVYCLAMETAPPVEGTLVVLITKTWFYHVSDVGQSQARMMQSLGVVHCWE